MTEQYMDRVTWERAVQTSVRRCVRQCLTPIHYIMILGQEVDELLQQVAPQYQHQAIELAREFGYETAEERRALQTWVQQEHTLNVASPEFVPTRPGAGAQPSVLTDRTLTPRSGFIDR